MTLPREHALSVEHLKGLTIDGSAAHQAVCSCGWKGEVCYFEDSAEDDADRHKAEEI